MLASPDAIIINSGPTGSGKSTTGRSFMALWLQHGNGQRRIITQQYMEPEKTYYVRFKSALEATDGQFILDNFELCPSYIYNGPEGEDVW